jgi:multisubunit Na+/H+ antiporter MnhE subunit
MKPGLVGFLIGFIFWLFHRFFYHQRILLPADIKIIKLIMILLCSIAATAGVIKIVLLATQ